jgi:iron complex outermembrane receptor protein
VLHPLPKLQITVDAYQIKIKNRIVPSGDIFGYDSAYKSNGGVVSQAVLNALTSRGVSLADATSYSGIDIYTNGVSTRTRGIEATANYASDFGEYGKVDWSVASTTTRPISPRSTACRLRSTTPAMARPICSRRIPRTR